MLITPGIIQTVLGNGQEGWSGDGGPALQAACQTPYMCAFDTQGNMFVCMGRHHRIRRMDATTGMIALVAGTGESTRSASENRNHAAACDSILWAGRREGAASPRRAAS